MLWLANFSTLVVCQICSYCCYFVVHTCADEPLFTLFIDASPSSSIIIFVSLANVTLFCGFFFTTESVNSSLLNLLPHLERSNPLDPVVESDFKCQIAALQRNILAIDLLMFDLLVTPSLRSHSLQTWATPPF